jgi:two-component system NtrC family sensor kinase
MEQPYRRLFRRMTATALVVALVPLYLLGGIIYFYFSQAHDAKLREELRNLAVNRVSALNLFLAERISMLEVLAATSNLEELTRPGALQGIFELLNRRSRSFLDLGVIDDQGRHRAYVGPYPLEDRSYAEAGWFLATKVRGVYVSDVFLGFRGVPHFVVAVKSGSARESWVLRATIDSEVFNRLVRSAQLGASGDAYILNDDGSFQTPPRFGNGLLNKAPLNMQAVPRGVRVVERVNAQGRKTLTAFAWLPKENWVLVIEQDPREGLGPLHLARTLELATLLAGSLFIAGAIIFLVRALVRRLESQARERAVVDAQLAHSARLASLGRMAAGVAHEINNPLAAIGELAGLMEDLADEEFLASHPHGPLFKENVMKIGQHVDRVRSVTHRMLGFARRMEPKLDTVDLNQVIDDALAFLAREAMFRNVTVEKALDDSLPLIKTDQAQLQQVLLNLINNALDAAPEGKGRVTVTTRRDGRHLEVAVHDNGPGVAPEIKDRIFDPFFTTKQPGKGTGLGLSISHSLVEKLGGSLTLESRPGGGATFLVRLPLVATEQ